MITYPLRPSRFVRVWELFVSGITYDRLCYVPCCACWALLVHWYQQHVTVNYVPRGISCHKAIVVITRRADCFHDYIHICIFICIYNIFLIYNIYIYNLYIYNNINILTAFSTIQDIRSLHSALLINWLFFVRLKLHQKQLL